MRATFTKWGVAALLYGTEHNNDMPIGRADVSYSLNGELCWYDALAYYMGRTESYVGGNNSKPIPLSAVLSCPANLANHQAAKPPTADPAFPSWPYTGDYGYNVLLNPRPSVAGA